MLAGLGRAFEILYQTTGSAVFIEGRAACGRLGLGLPDLNARDLEYFTGHAGVRADGGQPRPTPDEDVRTLQRAVAAGADEAEPVNDPPFFENLVGDPNGYRYDGLFRVIGDEASARPASKR